ncbi:hypothetical protein EI94DRAFT_1880812 [Lactarius quietus]|nr:hypothetical protein EI94DRAFT_1880812 [Lactarius quietus]
MVVDASLPKESVIMNDRKASIDYLHSTHTSKHTSLLDPDNENGSDVHSFDEEDMYGSDNSNDIISICLDSDDDAQDCLEDLACTALEAASDRQWSLVGIFDDVIQKIRNLHAEIGNASAMDNAFHEMKAAYQGKTCEPGMARDVIVPNAVPSIEEVVVKHTRTKTGRTRMTEKVVPVILPSLAASSKSKKGSRDKTQAIVQGSEMAIPTQDPTEHTEEHEYPHEQEYGGPEFTTQGSQPQARLQWSNGSNFGEYFFMCYREGRKACVRQMFSSGMVGHLVQKQLRESELPKLPGLVGRETRAGTLTPHLCDLYWKSFRRPRTSGQLPTPQETPQPECGTSDAVASDALFDLMDLDANTSGMGQTRTATSGNPLFTIVDRCGVFEMEVVFCVCSDGVLEDFLIDNLECKTTAQKYYSKLQIMTNRMFPNNVPNRYKQLLRASCQWRDLKSRMESGVGHMNEGEAVLDGERDVSLSARMAFMANPDSYKTHLWSGWECAQPSTCNTYRAIEQANSSQAHLDVTGIGATACCHGFFVPTSVVDFQKGERHINMDYSICKALSFNMTDIPFALVMYDIMCQYRVHFQKRVKKSPELSIPSSLELRMGIGLFHIHGLQDSCLPQFSPSFILGVKQVDGEIIETLWAPLNNISQSLRGMSLVHRQEVLDAHINHLNWKKLVWIVPMLLKRWKCLELGLDKWLEEDRVAQANRKSSPSAMDIYDTVQDKVPSCAKIQQELMVEEIGDHSIRGQTSWISCGLKIQELQSAIKYQLQSHGSNMTVEDSQILENKCTRLQKMIDMFSHQSDAFLLNHELTEDLSMSPLGDYVEYDHADDMDDSGVPGRSHGAISRHSHRSHTADGSGINTEDIPLCLPSSLGWEWCVRRGHKSLAKKEAKLHFAQVTNAIHRIHLALGFKSALFQMQVRHSQTQKTKSRSWAAVHNPDASVQEHAWNYSKARDAYVRLSDSSDISTDSEKPSKLPLLKLADLHVHTVVLGVAATGQWNQQLSWIWSLECPLDRMVNGWMTITSMQLTGSTGSEQRHNLRDGKKSRTAFTMKLYGSLHISMHKQSFGGIG